MASETVEINKAKYTKYSDAEVRTYIVKMNSVQPEMTVDQVVSLLGKPIREQIVSASPPQRILVFPLSIVVSIYLNSRTRTWLVTAPPLYGTPLCQREDGVPQKNAIGADVIEYPNINCIPRKFGPPPPKSTMTAQSYATKWELLYEAPSRGNSLGAREYFDAANIDASGKIKKVRLLTSLRQEEQKTYKGAKYRSMITQTWISCDEAAIAEGRNLFNKADEYYAGEMGTGAIVESSIKSKTDEADDLYWKKDYGGDTTKKFCQ